jgi:FkbM family methyltransferase
VIIKDRLHAVKSRFEELARDRFFGSPIFPTVRTAYQSLFSRHKLAARRQLTGFYSQFIRPGDLVFDVGANVGIYADAFTELGARVVAIEPNPECVRLLRKLSERTHVQVEPCAVSDTPGSVLLQLSELNQLSSANPEWRSMVERSPDHGGGRWSERIEVESITLDQLAKRYGVPQFVKIDVEGFDDRVMFGMSFQPAALSFEFNRLLPSVGWRCFDAPILEDNYEFNFQDAIQLRCVLPAWLSRAKFAERLENLVGPNQSGDVVARRKDHFS